MPRFPGLLPAKSSETIFIIIYLLKLTVLGLDRRQTESKNADTQWKASWEVGGEVNNNIWFCPIEGQNTKLLREFVA